MAGILGIKGFEDLEEKEVMVILGVAAQNGIYLYHDGVLKRCCQNSVSITGFKSIVNDLNKALAENRNGNGHGKPMLAAVEYYGEESFNEL